ncbi:uncharacterized protein DS421_3g78470 [Arachis hypogaea]|nr:uncharacterized protein DS421_3g78470 [Arachis hypogaea]
MKILLLSSYEDTSFLPLDDKMYGLILMCCKSVIFFKVWLNKQSTLLTQESS